MVYAFLVSSEKPHIARIAYIQNRINQELSVIMLVIIDISEKNLFKNLFHWKGEKLTSNKLKITLFQNLLEMN